MKYQVLSKLSKKLKHQFGKPDEKSAPKDRENFASFLGIETPTAKEPNDEKPQLELFDKYDHMGASGYVTETYIVIYTFFRPLRQAPLLTGFFQTLKSHFRQLSLLANKLLIDRRASSSATTARTLSLPIV